MSILRETRTQMLLVAATMLLLSGTSSATDNKLAGKELIEKARTISDIRAEDAAAFRMEGSFRIVSKASAEEIKGHYTEIWVSKTKWRREVETTSFHRLEVGGFGKKWLADSGTDRPEAALYGPLTLLFSKSAPDVTGVTERDLGDVKATCVESKTGWSKDVDCVDPQSGVFLMRETLFKALNPVHHSCLYRNYEKFGDHLFPRSVRCVNDPGDDVELTISKLAAEASPEEGLFTKPQGASEIGNCQGGVKAPHAEYSPDPNYPDHHKENMTVVMWTTIGVDGKPQDLRVVRSGGQDFDRPALEAVRKWRFKPATCDGLPVAVQINVEVTFRKF
jgi:TonB family protein